jgi:hypothetical protein
MGRKRNKEKIILKISPLKERDFVHLSEITHGTGCGPHGGDKPREVSVDLGEFGCPICGILDCYDCEEG